MTNVQWVRLTVMHDRVKAEIFKSVLEAYEIPAELFQEAVGHHAFPTLINGLAETQIFVPRHNLNAAQQLLARFSRGEQTSD